MAGGGTTDITTIIGTGTRGPGTAGGQPATLAQAATVTTYTSQWPLLKQDARLVGRVRSVTFLRVVRRVLAEKFASVPTCVRVQRSALHHTAQWFLVRQQTIVIQERVVVTCVSVHPDSMDQIAITLYRSQPSAAVQ